MQSDRAYGGAPTDVTLLLTTHQMLPASSPAQPQLLQSFWLSTSSPSLQGDSVSGSVSMVNFRNLTPENVRIRGSSPSVGEEEMNNEDYEPCLHQPEKKRRLTSDQVEFLEKNFEVDNKLEPERKAQLAKDLGLQPRQIAIWFQNRRARYKTKQLEKDYSSLKASYDKLKADYDSLVEENEKLKTEVRLVEGKLLVGGKVLEQCDPINAVDAEHTEKPSPDSISQNVVNLPVKVLKQEDANSAKSDVLDSDSPLCADGKQTSSFDPVDSSPVFEHDQSEFSHDEDDNLCRILPPPCLPKLEIEAYDDLNADPCNLGSSDGDQPLWFWTY